MPPWSRRRTGIVGGAVAAGLLIAGLSLVFVPGEYSVNSAPDGGSRQCASVVAELPESVVGEGKRETTGPGTAAWGDGRIVLRCGVPPLSPTANLCVDVDGVDWVLDEARARGSDARVLTTYGREPAIEVTVRDSSVSPGDVLVDLGRAVGKISQGDHRCVSLDDMP
ncbi:DUF3515 domain-containing protein [Streptomyces sp. NPDC049879]|uniref:DUF3515 domain-containing protein n=1 Tax=Streptomyces sp. NPDC049879 TaxID=3365598 RepID=UPI0037AC2908